MPKESTYHLILRSQPNAVPADVRLKRLLKLVLRSFGFRCVSVREVEAEAKVPAEAKPV